MKIYKVIDCMFNILEAEINKYASMGWKVVTAFGSQTITVIFEKDK
jgi:hypothetical protein